MRVDFRIRYEERELELDEHLELVGQHFLPVDLERLLDALPRRFECQSMNDVKPMQLGPY